MIVKHFMSMFKGQEKVQIELPDSVMRLTIDEAIALHEKLGRILGGFLPEKKPKDTE